MPGSVFVQDNPGEVLLLPLGIYAEIAWLLDIPLTGRKSALKVCPLVLNQILHPWAEWLISLLWVGKRGYFSWDSSYRVPGGGGKQLPKEASAPPRGLALASGGASLQHHGQRLAGAGHARGWGSGAPLPAWSTALLLVSPTPAPPGPHQPTFTATKASPCRWSSLLVLQNRRETLRWLRGSLVKAKLLGQY